MACTWWCIQFVYTCHIWLERGHGSHCIHGVVRPAIDFSRDVCQFCHTAPYLNLFVCVCVCVYVLTRWLAWCSSRINLIHISSTKWQCVRLMVFSAKNKCPSMVFPVVCPGNVLINTETAVLRSHEITFDHRYSSSSYARRYALWWMQRKLPWVQRMMKNN